MDVIRSLPKVEVSEAETNKWYIEAQKVVQEKNVSRVRSLGVDFVTLSQNIRLRGDEESIEELVEWNNYMKGLVSEEFFLEVIRIELDVLGVKAGWNKCGDYYIARGFLERDLKVIEKQISEAWEYKKEIYSKFVDPNIVENNQRETLAEDVRRVRSIVEEETYRPRS